MSSYEMNLSFKSSHSIHMLTQTSHRLVAQCPCSQHSESGSAHMPHPDNIEAESPKSPSGKLTSANLSKHNRQSDDVHAAGHTGAKRAERLNVAAQSLGFNISDVLKHEVDDSEGALPMERFMMEKEASTNAKKVAEEVKEEQGNAA